ncbi:MAG: hypothetical protein FWG40_08610 [Peptococcaceae bacterium]|nr:hypothetical protein [Peptococcaceae bacterium]
MKKLISVVAIAVVFLFSGCGTDETVDQKDPDYGETGSGYPGAYSQDEGYYYLRDKKIFSELYSGIEVTKGMIDARDSSGRLISIILIDNDYNGYHFRDSENGVKGEIGMYNLDTEEYTKLLVVPLGSQVALNTVNEKYLIWTESMDDSEWYKTRLHLYDKMKKEDIVFYTHSTDPVTGMVYSWNWSNPVIVGDKIYFDDYTEEIKMGQVKVDMFCYSIVDGKVIKVQEMAKWPTKFRGNVAWNEMSEKEYYSNIYSYNGVSKTLLTSIKSTGSMSTMNSGGEILVLSNGLSSRAMKLENPFVSPQDEQTIDCNGVQIFKDGKFLPIIISRAAYTYLEWPKTNGQVVVFGAYEIYKKPVFYDVERDVIVEMDAAESGFLYGTHLSDTLLMYTRRENPEDEKSRLCYYMIDLEKLK